MADDDNDSFDQEDIDALKGLTSGYDECSQDNNIKNESNNAEDKSIQDSDSHDNPIVELTEKLMENNVFKTMGDTNEIYYYNEKLGIFVDDGKSIIEMQAESMLPEISCHQVNEVINHIRRRTLTGRTEFNSQIEWLACKDCMINLKTLEIKPHSSEFMVTVQIPVLYNNKDNLINDFFEMIGDNDDDDSSCPAIMKFMREVMAEEDIETVLDFIAYCLWRGFPFHKYLLFNGSGRNGKGVMLGIIKRLLGNQNIAGETLHRLLENRFAIAELYGKLANIDADLSKEALKNTGTLKKLTGEDYIPAEKKFLPPFKFVNRAKLLFSANEIPKTEDESDAFFSRLIIINFPNQFLGDKADRYLIDKITTEEELSGLLKLILKRLPRVLRRGIFTASSSIDENYSKYILSSNPVRAFGEAALEQIPIVLLQKKKCIGLTKCSAMINILQPNQNSHLAES
jgi:P4 family phage/plasmid primase-like protien